MTETQATRRLAGFAAGLAFEDIPDACRERARMFVLDALGIMVAAVDFMRREGQTQLESYIRLVEGTGPATLVGLGRTATPAAAAFFNGTLSEVLDCQDTNLAARIHNGTAAIPVALAIAEERSLGGADVMTALVAGYEVGSRLSLAIQPHHWHRGFQATGTIGTCGAAATAGRLLGFDAARMAHCLGISGFIMPVSNSDNFFKGYSIKPIHGGQAAICGLQAAHLAISGYEAGPLEGEPPRHHAILRTLSDGNPDLTKCTDGFGSVWHSLEVAFKPYPVGLLNVGPIQLALQLRRDPAFDVDAIECIEVATYKEAALFTGQKYTTPESNFIDCHLSLPFCVAVALIDGEVTPRQLLKSRTTDPRIHELAARVHVREEAAMSARYPYVWPATMDIQLVRGERLHAKVEEVEWSPRRPATWEQLVDKFRTVAVPLIGTAQASDVVRLTERLEEIGDIRALTSKLGPG
jgi:2-methylcitrate dehydratase PrpD